MHELSGPDNGSECNVSQHTDLYHIPALSPSQRREKCVHIRRVKGSHYSHMGERQA